MPTLGSAAVDEPVDPPSEAVENPSSRDDGELTRLENDLAAIEEAMDRIEEGDLDGYDVLVARFDDPARPAPNAPTGVDEAV